MAIDMSLLAFILSIISIIWSIKSYRFKIYADSLASSVIHLVEIEKRIGDYPQLLRFHGISNPDEELKKYGLTAQEFAYLINSFSLAGIYYRISPRPNEIIKKGSYRDAMFMSPATIKAWPLIRIMLTDSAFRDMLDRIFDDNNKKQS